MDLPDNFDGFILENDVVWVLYTDRDRVRASDLDPTTPFGSFMHALQKETRRKIAESN